MSRSGVWLSVRSLIISMCCRRPCRWPHCSKFAPPVRRARVEAVLGRSADLGPALFDLKRMGPHLLVVGPPLSGKTTTLYSYLLSLAYRYPPDQVLFVLVDLQRRFLEYGGRHRLSELPHVVAAITEIEQFDPVLASLQREGDLMLKRESSREIFVLIDNFEDFNEEIESARTLVRDLGTLVRRYGRDGLHFIAAAGPDTSTGELRRRIQSANLGIGLRTAAAVEALRVLRTPAGFRGGNTLAPGRGYRVASGQTAMIQIATPYEGGSAARDGALDEEGRAARALDTWVELLAARYPNQHAAWMGPAPQASVTPAGPTPSGRWADCTHDESVAAGLDLGGSAP